MARAAFSCCSTRSYPTTRNVGKLKEMVLKKKGITNGVTLTVQEGEV